MSDSKKRPDIIRHTLDSSGKPFVKETDIRGNQVNVNDIEKVYTVGINDIDEGILYHLRHNILPSVDLHGMSVVPEVVFATPEIAASIHSEGVYRDNAKKIIYPVIVLERESIETDLGRPKKLDANYTQQYYTYAVKYTAANKYDKFDVLNNKIPVQEIRRIAIPDFIKVNYICYVYTDFIEHNNKIIESIKYATPSYWGNGANSYRTDITNIPTSVEYSSDNGGRVVLSQFSILSHGSILPDAIIRHMNSTMKQFTKSVINIKIDENY